MRSDNSGSSGGVVTFSGHAVSVEACQDIFQQITKPKTSLSKNYSNNLMLEYDDIENLNYMIGQALRGENLVALNSSIIVVHRDKSQAVFGSFEEFNGYATGGSSPTRVVVLIYEYAIKYGNEEKFQNYQIKIEINSKLTSYEVVNDDQLPSPMKALLVRVMPTVEVRIKYDDYIKAKNIIDLLDTWVSGRTNSDNYKSNIIKRLQTYSDAFSAIFSSLFIFGFMFYLQKNINDFVTKASNVQELAIFFIQILGISFLIIMIARGVGKLIENFLDFYPFLSYVSINKGDQNLIEKRKDKLFGVFLKIMGAIVIGALGSYLMAVVCGLFPSLNPL